MKIYRRHGAGENAYGVSFGEPRPPAKKLGTDHGRHASSGPPAAMTDARVGRSDYDLPADLVGGLVLLSPFAIEAIDDWTRSDEEVRRTGYVTLASYLRSGEPPPSDAACRRRPRAKTA